MYQVRDRSRAFLVMIYRLYKTSTPSMINPTLIELKCMGIFVNGGGLSRSMLS